jgi:ribosomal protein S18 acetylase RimI-like enzyme
MHVHPALDREFLERMLFEAFFWDPTIARPPFAEFRENPEFAKLSSDWGRTGDHGLVATVDDVDAGAAWWRYWTDDVHSYGYVASDIPEIALAVASSHRSRGIGRLLLRRLIEDARARAIPALSLSVSPQNRASELYRAEGFREVGVSGTSLTMLLQMA